MGASRQFQVQEQQGLICLACGSPGRQGEDAGSGNLEARSGEREGGATAAPTFPRRTIIIIIKTTFVHIQWILPVYDGWGCMVDGVLHFIFIFYTTPDAIRNGDWGQR